jgi:hypothetical protein
MRAFNLVRPEPHYRRDAFDAGLRAAGYDIVDERQIGTPQPSDVLVIWNRYGHWDVLAQRFEKVGAAVLITENGYLGRSENAYAKPFTTDAQEPESQLYALALNHHNGGGRWWIGEPGRWRGQGIEIRPWRIDGEHVLVLPQRGIGPAGVSMPRDWPERMLARLRTLTHRPVRLRDHPGNAPAQKPLAADLGGAWCVVTWGSGAAIKALCAGVPAYSDWPRWIGFPGALPFDQIGLDDPPHWHEGAPLTADTARRAMLDRLAWAQHTVAELATGEPIMRLLEIHRQRVRDAA